MDDLTERLTGWLLAAGVKAYLVGGYVRDRLLRRPIDDIDVAVDGDAVAVGRAAADALGGAFYVLDETRGTARILLTMGNGKVKEVDLARLKEGGLAADLAARDFTVNAMALALADREVAGVIDPHGGRADLRAKRLRVVGPTSVADDPIRILRAVRLSSELSLRIDPGTDALLRESTPLLARVSAERIRDEWLRILALPAVAEPLAYLDETGVLWALLERFGVPRPDPTQRQSRFARAAETLAALSALMDRPDEIAPFRARLGAHLAEPVTDRHSRGLLLTLVALLEPLAGTDLDAVLVGLHLSNAELRRARTLRDARADLASIAVGPDAAEISLGMLYSFYRQAGDAGPDALAWYLSQAGAEESRAANLAYRGWQAYFDAYTTIVAPPRLIDGDTLIAHFDLQPGPRLRTLLDSVGEAQAEGRIASVEEALGWVERLLTSTG